MSDRTVPPVWINGQPESRLPVTDRGLAYGDGLFETIRITERGPVLLEYHLDRLIQGCRRLHIPLPREAILAELERWPGFAVPGIVKLIVTRGSGGRGYAPAAMEPCRILQHFTVPHYPDAWFERGIRVFSCQTRLGLVPELVGIKHLNRLEQVLARGEWDSSEEFQEGLVSDLHGCPVEGTMSNFFIVRNQQVQTPRLDQCGVHGVMRRWLIEQLRDAGLEVMETTITLDGFRVADDRFFCNSVFGVWPVARFEDAIWSPGPVVRFAQQLIHSHFF